ncbi:MAG TPA: hypothetical protein VK728_07065 [Candidatus Sulfotelmatobacter sp.]|nr:hypothetical protein [Candidatus Sulfotelmatobacter sp.]
MAPEKKGEVYPRGLKLMLTDGTYQLVREYERNGEHVRYYSLERGAWEELPASMVDWNATAKMEEEEKKRSTELVEKVHKQEEARRMDNVADIDASLRVGDGAFLPSGEGMFLVEGKTIRILDQAGSEIKMDKKRLIAQVMSPVPLVPGKQSVVLQGSRAVVRVKTNNPEFYLREAPPDPNSTSTIKKSRRAGESGPDVELVRTKVGRNNRQLESINTLFGQAVSENMNEISMQRWEVAPNVYRFTLSQALPPGEYVLAEALEDGLNLYVWDFGVDAPVGKTGK